MHATDLPDQTCENFDMIANCDRRLPWDLQFGTYTGVCLGGYTGRRWGRALRRGGESGYT
jgi:hypothetical protein